MTIGILACTLLQATLRKATPLIWASLGGFCSERSGVINIALEGIMLWGAFIAAAVAYATHSAHLALLAAVAGGVLVALIHAVACISLRVNQIVSGVAINLLAAGGTVFLSDLVTHGARSFSLADPDRLGRWGPFLPLVYGALLAVVVLTVVAYRTRFGLRLRAVGEDPQAAVASGLNAKRLQYAGVLLSGALASLGGAYLPFFAGSFARNMSGGLGFVALAALIFGKWHPLGAAGAALFFGFADALQEILQGKGGVPVQMFQAFPYILTMIALVSAVGRSIPPGGLGRQTEAD